MPHMIVGRSRGAAGLDYYNTVLTFSPVHYWRFGESSGNFVDAIAGNTATAVGTWSYSVAGAVAGDTAVSGANNGYANVAGIGSLPIGGAARTVLAFYKGTSTQQTAFISYGTNSTRRSFAPDINGGAGSPRMGIWVWADDKWVTATGLLDGNWHHLAWVYGGSTTAVCYMDGSSLGTLTFGGTLNTASSTPRIAGNYLNTGDDRLNGAMDELAVIPSALSAGDIAAIYAAI